jgi:hypothetical protein
MRVTRRRELRDGGIVKPAKTDSDEPPPEREPNTLASYYRQKASECLRFAEAASDAAAREEWITLANGWTQLALHTQR